MNSLVCDICDLSTVFFFDGIFQCSKLPLTNESPIRSHSLAMHFSSPLEKFVSCIHASGVTLKQSTVWEVILCTYCTAAALKTSCRGLKASESLFFSISKGREGPYTNWRTLKVCLLGTRVAFLFTAESLPERGILLLLKKSHFDSIWFF